MSIARPTPQNIQHFIQGKAFTIQLAQQAKKNTGEWTSVSGIFMAGFFFSTLLAFSIYRSVTPTGIVARLNYERTLSFPHRHLRHLAPSLVCLGGLIYWDAATGLFTTRQKI